MKKTNLFIDDLRKLPDCLDIKNTIIARNSEDALNVLKNNSSFETIWFDHDLGGEDTTMPVAEYLAELAFNGTPYEVDMIYIHTANPVGRKNLKSIFDRWGYKTRGVIIK